MANSGSPGSSQQPPSNQPPDPFSSSNDSTPRSPLSNTPYYIASSSNGMRDKWPRLNVPPHFKEILARAVESKKVPQWKSTDSVSRFALAVGLKEIAYILDDDAFTGLVNQYTHIAELETLMAEQEASARLVAMVEDLAKDRFATRMAIEKAKRAIDHAIETSSDPEWRERLERARSSLR